MSLNTSIHYVGNRLFVDDVSVLSIIHEVGTPTYIYSLKRAISNYHRIQEAFKGMSAHVHYSAKANANLTLLRALHNAGAGIDAVSGGEIFRARQAGVPAEKIVYAGVGKTDSEIQYALEEGVGWFNVENVAELHHINTIAHSLGKHHVKIALRLNPDVTANTHPYIATGHGGAKFGLTAETVSEVLANQAQYPELEFAGIHVHIGSNLQDTHGTAEAVTRALELIAPYPHIRTVNMGGGLPAQYEHDKPIPEFTAFADSVRPLLKGYEVILEPGRSIIADSGILVSSVLYPKYQAGQRMAIVDASMTEIMRPMLYQARHEIVPLHKDPNADQYLTQVHGPVCETTDVLGRDMPLPLLEEGDLLAILTVGAYGTVMASNYNARPRPTEIVVREDGKTWSVARRRETWQDLIQHEQTVI